ncbi:maestro heat-like repeat-containing protein family member 2B [Harpia harpyja]|uniref:maestro heat-like repeat-containing protein family member 2B n=1 Tax=Harpia harpyja TaxID=202280 RepID=UPI0022B08766|nr:maestro heat-like repeat-containing protein family member 2B [Harpia harpyja]
MGVYMRDIHTLRLRQAPRHHSARGGSKEEVSELRRRNGQVPEVLRVLCSRMQTMQEDTHRPLLLQAAYLLARFHHEPVVDSLLQKRLPMDGDATELWRILGRSSLGVQVLKYLKQKLEAAGENSPGPHSSAHKLDHSQAALESLTLPRAVSEVVFVLPAKERVQRLLPRLLPGLLGEISKALGEGMLLAPLRCQRGLFFSASRSEDKPRSPYCGALELVLSRCVEKRWLLLLRRQGAWASLKNPQAQADGVILLTSVLLRNRLVTRGAIWTLSQWLNSPSGNLQLTATACFAELMKDPPVMEKKFLESVLGVSVEKSQHGIGAVRQMAVRGLGNAVRGAPKEEELSKLTATEEPAGSSPMYQRLRRLRGLVGKPCNSSNGQNGLTLPTSGVCTAPCMEIGGAFGAAKVRVPSI